MSSPSETGSDESSDGPPLESSDGPLFESERTASGNGFLGDTAVSLKRWLRKTSRSPFVTVSSLVQPIVFFVLLASVFGAVAADPISGAYGDDVSYVAFLAPAIVIQSALAAAAVSGIGLVKDMETGMFDTILVSPLDRRAMILGKVLSELLRVAVQTMLILGLGALAIRYSIASGSDTYLETGLPGVVGVVAVALLFSLVFVAFSNVVALVTRDEEATILIANLLTFPLLFLSSAFLPLEALPDWIQRVAVGNPVTYGVDGVRAFVLGEDVATVLDVTAFGGLWNTVVPAAAVLAGFALALGVVAGKLLERAWKAEVR